MSFRYFKLAGLLLFSVFLFSLKQINAQQMIEGIHYATGKPVQIKIVNGKIAEIKSIKN